MSAKVVQLPDAPSRRKKKRNAPPGSRADFVREKVREGIRGGRYQPGERIRENELADWLNVSRTPVREALRRLESEGLLTFVSWRGVVVTELDRTQVGELYAMREILEGAAARLAARHISDVELDVLDQLLSAADTVTDDPAELADLNQQFHETIQAAAHNRYLTESLEQHRNALALLRGTTYAVEERAQQAAREHRAIVKAIRERDPDRAETAARKHIAAAQRVRLKLILDAERKERSS